MKEYTVKIQLKSDTIPGSGEGLGAVIDADIVFDDTGFPLIPAKRFKGCLRESANDVCAMLEKSHIDSLDIDLNVDKSGQFKVVNELFGEPGKEKSAPIFFSNLATGCHDDSTQALAYFQKQYPKLVTPEAVVQTFTYLRQSTAINPDGTADDHSLRTARVLKKGLEFVGTISLQVPDGNKQPLLALACLNLRRIGGKRRRGFGEITCELYDGEQAVRVDL